MEQRDLPLFNTIRTIAILNDVKLSINETFGHDLLNDDRKVTSVQ